MPTSRAGVPIVADAREALVALTQAADLAGIQPNAAYTRKIGKVESGVGRAT